MATYKVTMRDGRVYEVNANSADEARQYVIGMAGSTSRIIRTQKEGGKFHPFGIGSPEYNREHSVNPRTGMPRR